ncbi:type III pantothenate kinase [Nibribacter ruber]|uniref:Type III pantothenate kinase n=1 Tax=Nibribacter ruber TaxID=2698458 RepID=A0A6P1P4X3_9BACT|nr:type III pantothenate kinase [Nibribacter ruber]
MNLAIDMGNSRIKVGFFESGSLVRESIFSDLPEIGEAVKGQEVQHVIVSSVRKTPEKLSAVVPLTGKQIQFSSQTPVPLQNAYATPHTLGVDRLAAAVGASYLFPGQNCLVIDAGTCITYDLVEAAGIYQGGNISPGLNMRYQAMHTFTGKLPLLSGTKLPLRPGKTTEQAMQGGVLYGLVAEVEGIIQHYERQYKSLTVVLCGGDAPFFESTVKARIFVIPELVLIGLNRILEYNV